MYFFSSSSKDPQKDKVSQLPRGVTPVKNYVTIYGRAVPKSPLSKCNSKKKHPFLRIPDYRW